MRRALWANAKLPSDLVTLLRIVSLTLSKLWVFTEVTVPGPLVKALLWDFYQMEWFSSTSALQYFPEGKNTGLLVSYSFVCSLNPYLFSLWKRKLEKVLPGGCQRKTRIHWQPESFLPVFSHQERREGGGSCSSASPSVIEHGSKGKGVSPHKLGSSPFV